MMSFFNYKKGSKKGYMEREGFFYNEIHIKCAGVIHITLLIWLIKQSGLRFSGGLMYVIISSVVGLLKCGTPTFSLVSDNSHPYTSLTIESLTIAVMIWSFLRSYFFLLCLKFTFFSVGILLLISLLCRMKWLVFLSLLRLISSLLESGVFWTSFWFSSNVWIIQLLMLFSSRKYFISSLNLFGSHTDESVYFSLTIVFNN